MLHIVGKILILLINFKHIISEKKNNWNDINKKKLHEKNPYSF